MRLWLAGLIASAAGAVVGIVGPIVAAPEAFISGPGAMKKLLIVAGFSVLSHMCAYLNKSPLPGVQNGSNPKLTE